MNFPPVLSVQIIYNMHESSSNLHNVFTIVIVLCLSLLTNRPRLHVSVPARVTLSPSPSFRPFLSPGLPACVGQHDKHLPQAACCAQIMDVLLL